MIRTPAPGELLDAWDAGSALHPLERSGPLLRAFAGLDRTALEELGIGERDRVLVGVRERLFGDILRAAVDCPSCGLVLELALPTASLLDANSGPAVVKVEVGDYRVSCRVLHATDLADAAATESPKAARDLLVLRAVRSAERDGQPVPAIDLPDDLIAAMAAALADADPLAIVELPISCDGCGATWTRLFDIESYLWRELDAWAVWLLGEIHVLASAYGWSEGEILALSPRRRRRYLELAAHG